MFYLFLTTVKVFSMHGLSEAREYPECLYRTCCLLMGNLKVRIYSSEYRTTEKRAKNKHGTTRLANLKILRAALF